MERSYEEKAEAHEPARSGARPLGWLGAQRSQKTRKQAERPQGWLGEKPQEDPRRQTQCPPSATWTAQEDLNVVIAMIRARFGYLAIGLGNGGIRYSPPARH
jgi:hypothetical protein